MVEEELLVRCKTISLGLKSILRIEVEESAEKPHYAINEKGERIIYIRTKDKSVPTNRLMLPGEGDAATDKLLNTKPVKNLIQYLKQNDAISDKEFARITNVSEKRAARLMNELMETGVVMKRGSGRTAQYSLKLVK